MQDNATAPPPASPPTHAAPAAASSFDIKLSRAKAFTLYGKGTLQVGEHAVMIHARRHRLFRTGVPATQTIALGDIFDVAATGASVEFDVWGGTRTTPLKVRFGTASEAVADAVIHALPTRQTHDFAREQADHNVFFNQLDALRTRVWVTPLLVALNVIVFVLMLLSGAGLFAFAPMVAQRWGSNFGQATFLHGQWWRLLSSTFIHFGLIHIAINMIALSQVGPIVERIFGSKRFLLLYLGAGMYGQLASLSFHPDANGAGASGAIFGIVGGLLAFVLNPRNVVPPAVMKSIRARAIPVLLFNLGMGVVLYYLHYVSIDNVAHVGGLLGGIAMGILLSRPLSRA